MLTEFQKKVILTLAENNISIAATARELNFHRNSIVYHLNRIAIITDLEPRYFFDLVKLVRMAEEN